LGVVCALQHATTSIKFLTRGSTKSWCFMTQITCRLGRRRHSFPSQSVFITCLFYKCNKDISWGRLLL